MIVSYVIGIAFWASGSLAKIPFYAHLVVSSENQPQFLGLIVTLLPEFVGTVVGGVMIRIRQSVGWVTAIGTMVLAMLTSWILGSLMITCALHNRKTLLACSKAKAEVRSAAIVCSPYWFCHGLIACAWRAF